MSQNVWFRRPQPATAANNAAAVVCQERAEYVTLSFGVAFANANVENILPDTTILG